jgi:putative transposase
VRVKFRRNLLLGGTYFFTVNLQDRGSALLVERICQLRHAVRVVRGKRPFQIDAWVVLPEHMHCVWTLPEGDADYAGRWRAIKTTFSKSLSALPGATRLRTGGGNIWQPRYWEHTIRDDRDYRTHIDYVHLNPYKHGLVKRVRDWPYSTFHRYVAAGVYPVDWLSDMPDVRGGEKNGG